MAVNGVRLGRRVRVEGAIGVLWWLLEYGAGARLLWTLSEAG